MERYVCIHGHFYQPPRENPWLEYVELQDSAHPYHDWNERITAECYGPNAASRILDPDDRIAHIVNNYSRISFNFGPTLLSWMQNRRPEIYEAVIQADRLSIERFSGHGSAMAQVFNHMIMPLADTRDKWTQALWGIEDFKKRFGRDPEGMWLPETAVDHETLDILARLKIKFTILSPRQASQVRPIKPKAEWQDVSNSKIDPSTPYLCRLPTGRKITLFFYDGPISHDLAFGGLLGSGETLRDRFTAAFSDERDRPQIIHAATDGETFGHHQKQGEMALSYCLHLLESQEDVKLTNYGEFLEKHPPVMEVRIFENSSWSCVHGVERWRADCGCNSGMHPGWNQAWREPLRNSLNWLRDRAAELYNDMGPRLLKDPWKARDQYVEVLLDRSPASVTGFLNRHATGPLTPQDTVTALKLLEMQRFAQLIFTSCAWFFDEISGIESVQILQYAARTIQLIEELSGKFLDEKFTGMLADAPSNVLKNGAEAYEKYAKAAMIDMLRVGAHYAVSSLFEEYPESFDFAAHNIGSEIFNQWEMGRSKLVTGKAALTSNITGETAVIVFAVLHPGDHNITCGVSFFHTLQSFRRMENDLKSSFEHGDLAESIRMLDKHFGENTFSLWHLFRDEQRKVVNEILEPAYRAAEASYRQVYESNYAVLNYLHWLNIPPPRHFRHAAEYVINNDLKTLLRDESMDLDRLETLVDEAKKWSVTLDAETLKFLAAQWVAGNMENFARDPENFEILKNLVGSVDLLHRLPFDLNLWRAQNVYFYMGREFLAEQNQRAQKGDPRAMDLVEQFTRLGEMLYVRLA